MKLGEFMEKVKDLPPETLLCVAEMHEAFAMHVASVEQVSDGDPQGRHADGREAVELGNGKERVVVLRW